MWQVHPQAIATAAAGGTSSSSKQEMFTIWMKSLIMHGFGCTVFDSNGQIAYRVDNYSRKCSSEVFLMDTHGKVLFAVLKKKLTLFRCWEVYRRSTDDDDNPEKCGFRVRKRGDSLVMRSNKSSPHEYRMEIWGYKSSSCKIVDDSGVLLAEVKRKSSTSGVDLGEDVLAMVVEPYIDHSFVMALIVVYALYSRKM